MDLACYQAEKGLFGLYRVKRKKNYFHLYPCPQFQDICYMKAKNITQKMT